MYLHGPFGFSGCAETKPARRILDFHFYKGGSLMLYYGPLSWNLPSSWQYLDSQSAQNNEPNLINQPKRRSFDTLWGPGSVQVPFWYSHPLLKGFRCHDSGVYLCAVTLFGIWHQGRFSGEDSCVVACLIPESAVQTALLKDQKTFGCLGPAGSPGGLF